MSCRCHPSCSHWTSRARARPRCAGCRLVSSAVRSTLHISVSAEESVLSVVSVACTGFLGRAQHGSSCRIFWACLPSLGRGGEISLLDGAAVSDDGVDLHLELGRPWMGTEGAEPGSHGASDLPSGAWAWLCGPGGQVRLGQVLGRWALGRSHYTCSMPPLVPVSSPDMGVRWPALGWPLGGHHSGWQVVHAPGQLLWVVKKWT